MNDVYRQNMDNFPLLEHPLHRAALVGLASLGIASMVTKNKSILLFLSAASAAAIYEISIHQFGFSLCDSYLNCEGPKL